jgi:hypothetical protein
MNATITSAWKGTGAPADPYRPNFQDDYPKNSWVDTSGTPVTAILAGGATTVLMVTNLTPAQLSTIQADPRYAGKVTAQ